MTHREFDYRISFVLVSVLLVVFIPSNRLSAAPDISGPDLVIDAPWRTTRDYLPVLFFTPEFDGAVELRLNALRLSNYDPFSEQQETIFVDSRDSADDQFDCAIAFIGPEGEARSHLSETEEVGSFWHYIARVPVSCITRFRTTRGTPGEYFLRGEIDWGYNSGGAAPIDIEKTSFHVLRVIVTPDGFAKFSPVDHYFDVHVHTIAEQTNWHGILNPDASKKAFGGPLAMLMESAYALGMVDVQLENGNWSDYKNKIITTDHNSFFSKPPYDGGTAPGYGPTSHRHTDGKQREFDWYRDHLGELGGQEITVKGANGQPLEEIDIDLEVDWFPVAITADNVLGMGSHFLAYGSEHIEGPWHGGFLPQVRSPVSNNISITRAIRHMGSSNGFGYASHPESEYFGWSMDYYERAIGLPIRTDADFVSDPDVKNPGHNDGTVHSPILQKNQREFVFKGLQVWNGHGDMQSRRNGLLDFEEVHRFDPHTQRTRDQQFVPNPKWRKGHDKTYETYKRLLRRGLDYSFKHDQDRKFIRKLYLSAGTDSHAAFNDDISILASHAAEFVTKAKDIAGKTLVGSVALYLLDNADVGVGASADNNAFGRMRTYTLTSQRYIRAGASIPRNCETYPFCDGVHDAPTNFPLEDYKEGNTVATDGPVGRFSTDANCKFNSDIHKLTWHDDQCVWENHDGMIGGRGKFDGGNTMLAPVGNGGVMMRYDWIGKNDHRPDSESANSTMTFNLIRIKTRDSDHGDEDQGHEADGFHYFPFEDNGEFKPGQANRPNTAHINEILRNPPLVAFPHTSALILEGELSKSPDEVLNDPANIWFPRESYCIDDDEGVDDPCENGEVIDPYMTKFITNPIWIAPYKISVGRVRTCPIQPGQLRVTVEFGISMNTTSPGKVVRDHRGDPNPRKLERAEGEVVKNEVVIARRGRPPGGVDSVDSEAPRLPDTVNSDEKARDLIRVVVKPLDNRGNSTDVQYEISNQNSHWQAVEIPHEIRPKLISDAKYTTANTMTIPCGEGWNAENPKKKHDQNFASYAIIVDQIYDTHRNYLNPIARTVTTARPSSAFDPIINVGTLDDEVIGQEQNPGPVKKQCSARSKKVCSDFSADCEVIEAVNGSADDLCRWPTANSASQCKKTVGIWTTAQSKYASKHPGAVAAGTAGACITEAKNLKDRIQ